MTAGFQVHSAETYVNEPGRLWAKRLDARFQDTAFQLKQVEGKEFFHWCDSTGKPLARGGEVRQKDAAGTQPENLLAVLDRQGITGAVLYPSVAGRAYASIRDSEALTAILRACNDWMLEFAAASDRLRPAMLLNVDETEVALAEMERTAKLGAGCFVIPMSPGENRRYDQPRYEAIWAKAHELGKPITMLRKTHRHLDQAALDDRAEMTETSLPARLSMDATAVFPARRSITAITYAGVFERYPNLYMGVVGFPVSWAAYAMVRADEIYDVRPERTGPPTRVEEHLENAPPDVRKQVEEYLEQKAGVAIASDHRSGTVGMAPEGVGFHFKDGEKFSDHFRKNIFMTFYRDPMGMKLRSFIGVDGLLWGQRYPDLSEDALTAQAFLQESLEDLTDDERARIASANTARIYKF